MVLMTLGYKLWIDDLRPTPIGYTHTARTYSEAVALLAEHEFEFVSFDHDLAEEHYSGDFSRAKSGYDIALYVEEAAATGALKPFRWAVHSMNPTGRARIAAALTSANRYWGV